MYISGWVVMATIFVHQVGTYTANEVRETSPIFPTILECIEIKHSVINQLEGNADVIAYVVRCVRASAV